MTRNDASNAGEAAERFVRADAGAPGGAEALARWLAEHPANERALERVELAAVLGKRLAADPGSALFAEAATAARLKRQRRISSGVLAWGGAAAAAALVAALLIRDGEPPADPREVLPIEAARVVTFDAPTNPVAVLPSGVVVDASAVAVLPFSSTGDGVLAEGLERDVAAALETVPGLYVIAGAAVQPYAASELPPQEIGRQLGTRGVVDAAVELVDGRVFVSVRLRDSATGATLWRANVERPIDEVGAIRHEIAEQVAATMFDSELRERAAGADRSSAPVSVSKPLPQ
jgi:TolB-like protein